MATMKDRIIASLTAVLDEESAPGHDERIVARLHALGAPQSLIDATVRQSAALRAELPPLIAFVAANCTSRDSFAQCAQRCGRAITLSDDVQDAIAAHMRP